eukprot:COSAG02_NODE_439_length_22308_cov_18.013508_16_plen_219_part_00
MACATQPGSTRSLRQTRRIRAWHRENGIISFVTHKVNGLHYLAPHSHRQLLSRTTSYARSLAGMFGCVLTSIHAANRPLRAAGSSDASNSFAVNGPISVWQCLSASCHTITAHPDVFAHVSSHVATVAVPSPNGAVVWSVCLSFATAAPATCMFLWHSHAVPGGVGAGGAGGDGGKFPGGVGEVRVQFAGQVVVEHSGPGGATGGCGVLVRGRMGGVM